MATVTQIIPTGTLRLQPAPAGRNSASAGNAYQVEDLMKALDPTHQGPYIPSHHLPTPPLTSPIRNASDAAYEISDANVHALVQSIIASRGVMEGGDESAFFAADLSAVYQAVQMWRSSPMGSRVEIFYAAKCNPSPPILHLLALLGTSFDCASVAEFKQVLALPSAPGPDRIIFANPCKPAGFIRQAMESGVSMMTFDNADELYKIKRIYPGARLVLRILTDDSKSLCRFGIKFGAPLPSCPGLLQLAKALGLNVVGVSFHVGSGCKDPMQYADAVWRARKVFDMGKEVGYDFGLLDIGGGFERHNFAVTSQVVRDSLDLYFPEGQGIRVIAEPGRLLVSSALTLATNIIASRRALSAPEAGPSQPVCAAAIADARAAISADNDGDSGTADVMYYINDGVYGSFNCIMFDHQIVHPYPLSIDHEPTTATPSFPPPTNVQLEVDLPVQLGYTDTENASIWGPTCDSIDCVRSLVPLPKGMRVGDWIGWGEMGAYTLCAASTFNGFEKSPVHWTTGGDSPDAIATRATLDSFSGPSR